MGIDPFLISSSLNGILAQRLVRRICVNCTEEYEPTGEERVLCQWQKVEKLRFFRGAGCEVCSFSGYKGRIGIFEVIVLNDQIRELILGRPSANMITQAAGSKSFREDGLLKVDAGLTTMEEVLRVADED
jgi:type IV pilus assembly protein PilB